MRMVKQAINALLIEDSPDDTAMIQEIFNEPGCEVALDTAEKLSVGLERIARDGLDVIILDMNLPDSSGLDTLKKVLAKACNIPIVVLTGLSDESVGVEAVRQGAQDYIIKGELSGRLLKRSICYAIERKRIAIGLKASENKLQTIASVLGEGLLVVDAAGRLTFMNSEAEKLLGWRQQELYGRIVHDVIHHHDALGNEVDRSDCPIFRTTLTGCHSRVDEDAFIKKDGSFLSVSYVATPLTDNNIVTGSVTVFHDITERKQLIAALEKANELLFLQATTDTLTGIHNRLKFNELLKAEVQRTKRYGKPLSLIMFDIDYFKRVNDTHGHQAGDYVLREIAKIISEHLRKTDMFARWGGEEFMVLVPDNDIEQAAMLAEKLRSVVERHYFGEHLRMTASFGVTGFCQDDSLEAFANKADEALYRAKKNGRNRVEAL